MAQGEHEVNAEGVTRPCRVGTGAQALSARAAAPLPEGGAPLHQPAVPTPLESRQEWTPPRCGLSQRPSQAAVQLEETGHSGEVQGLL